jgi:hypothetical protein
MTVPHCLLIESGTRVILLVTDSLEGLVAGSYSWYAGI